MEDLNKNIGLRLKKVRHIFNEGSKLSGDQFAYLLETTGDKIRNYESGRAAVPVSLLVTLYHKGINPVYIITGEGSLFAPNEEGSRIESKIKARTNIKSNVGIISLAEKHAGIPQDMPVYKVAAGRLKKDREK